MLPFLLRQSQWYSLLLGKGALGIVNLNVYLEKIRGDPTFMPFNSTDKQAQPLAPVARNHCLRIGQIICL